MTDLLAQIADIDRALSACQFPSDNHSKDRVTVWHGHIDPLILCGVHEQNYLQEAFALKREGAINAYDTKQV
jgi:hypothetical protein